MRQIYISFQKQIYKNINKPNYQIQISALSSSLNTFKSDTYINVILSSTNNHFDKKLLNKTEFSDYFYLK